MKGRYSSELILALSTKVVRLFAIAEHQWNPTNWPKEYQQDSKQSPGLPGRIGFNPCGRVLMKTIGALCQEHGVASQIGIQTIVQKLFLHAGLGQNVISMIG
mmetsp:Transcript_11395/g.27488  ORF Transcript_11395/g.27488 Transcript_11395/m.27488 type:complete len:102 (-) Transcript_11395:342-647(-)